ncbi:MAG: HDOD domain-containing protein [Clostridiaceae bacterium]|nr:HDOD domain-containing protein [Clostridiaceae bacterium]
MQQERIFKLIEESGCLPQLPLNISQILHIIKNPIEADIDWLIEKVSASEELQNMILKNINCGFFKLNKEITTIKEAIVYLGMQTVQNMLIFYITLQFFPETVKKCDRTFDMHKYWRHVLGTSVASYLLAQQIKKWDKYELFSYGLMHDIGIVVLDFCLPQVLDSITEKLFNGVHQIVAERICMGGITHAELGAWVCRKWNIREDIINIVEFHHTPFRARANQDLVKLIYVADVISAEYYEKMLGINLDHNISEKVMNDLDLTNEHIEAVIKVFPEELEKAAYYFSV